MAELKGLIENKEVTMVGMTRRSQGILRGRGDSRHGPVLNVRMARMPAGLGIDAFDSPVESGP